MLAQDIFELVVDADISGGPFINTENKHIETVPKYDLYFKGHGGHAQNYHIFTPVHNKDWAMRWGNAYWTKDFPHAHVAYDHALKPGDSGKLRMEFWITPFDVASHDGPDQSIVSNLKDNDLIFGYDNVPHHPELNATFPYHKHVKSGERIDVVESDRPTHASLFAEILDQLPDISHLN